MTRWKQLGSGAKWTEVRKMIDKNAFKAKVEKQGNIVAISVKGDGSCSWLNMYLDCDNGQMTCDSDVGSYAYHWGRGFDTTGNFARFCCGWLGDEHWLLRKCVGENHVPLSFEYDATVESLRQAFAEYWDEEDLDTIGFKDAINEAIGYSDNKVAWMVAFKSAADRLGVDLPEEWYECVSEDYTPMQKRFAEICGEIIVPALRERLDGGADTNVPTNGGADNA